MRRLSWLGQATIRVEQGRRYTAQFLLQAPCPPGVTDQVAQGLRTAGWSGVNVSAQSSLVSCQILVEATWPSASTEVPISLPPGVSLVSVTDDQGRQVYPPVAQVQPAPTAPPVIQPAPAATAEKQPTVSSGLVIGGLLLGGAILLLLAR